MTFYCDPLVVCRWSSAYQCLTFQWIKECSICQSCSRINPQCCTADLSSSSQFGPELSFEKTDWCIVQSHRQRNKVISKQITTTKCHVYAPPLIRNPRPIYLLQKKRNLIISPHSPGYKSPKNVLKWIWFIMTS